MGEGGERRRERRGETGRGEGNEREKMEDTGAWTALRVTLGRG